MRITTAEAIVRYLIAQRVLMEPTPTLAARRAMTDIEGLICSYPWDCAEALFGSSEATTGTWRFLVYAGQNTRAVAVSIVPRGFVGSGTPTGTYPA